jgi:hypothetical protein
VAALYPSAEGRAEIEAHKNVAQANMLFHPRGAISGIII